MSMKANRTLDAKGLSCPMPIVKTKKAMNDLEPGQVMEVEATDKGSLADMKAWAKASGHHYLGTIQDGEVLKHYVRKASSEEEKEESTYKEVIDLHTLQEKLESDQSVRLLDVRESAEYAFGHIPGAVNIPLGELESRISEVDRKKEVLVICRTGNRSDMACQQLTEKGFTNVKNVVPGMSKWEGKLEKNN